MASTPTTGDITKDLLIAGLAVVIVAGLPTACSAGCCCGGFFGYKGRKKWEPVSDFLTKWIPCMGSKDKDIYDELDDLDKKAKKQRNKAEKKPIL